MNNKTIIITAVVLIFFGAACQKQSGSPTTSVAEQNNPNQPDLLIKHLGFNLAPYDPTTGMVGDVKFTKGPLDENLLWMDFGYIMPASSARPNPQGNPQPTAFLPIGTKVRSLVDGVVVNIPELYSHDFSVQVASASNSNWIYEMEHVVNPTVKKGDRVTAGQVVAEVGNWGAGNTGLGMFEIGILHGGNPPEHVCPFAYLDPSVQTDIQSTLTQLYHDWETYTGDTRLYDEAAMPTVGCYALAPIPG